MVLLSGMRAGQTMVPNAFIDRYLPSGNGEYVKVYLMLLRLMEDRSQEVSVTSLADRLDHTEKDVLRALAYWERQSLLSLKYENGQLQQVILLDVNEEPSKTAEPEGSLAEEDTAEDVKLANRRTRMSETAWDAGTEESEITKQQALVSETAWENGSEKSGFVKQQKSAAGKTWDAAPEKTLPPRRFDLQSVQEDEDFRQLVFVAETYLGRTLTAKDLELFGYLYKDLGFPVDLVEYLIEYCVDRGHKSLKYMEAVALGWHAEGKNSVQQVKEANRAYTKENKQVMKAFGIKGRVLGAEEQRMVHTWLHQYGMPLELVIEACNRTMTAIHQPSFEYADKILSTWHSQGVTTLEAAKALSEQHRSEKKVQKEPAPQKNNRFHNFDQRSTDYDALLKKGIR